MSLKWTLQQKPCIMTVDISGSRRILSDSFVGIHYTVWSQFGFNIASRGATLNGHVGVRL